MKRLTVASCLALAACITPVRSVEPFTGVDWQLLAIDGRMTDARATLRIDVDNVLAGAAPCNRWSAGNGVPLPALALGAIRSTRMACDRLAEEQAFFASLALMTAVQSDGDRNLILTGPDGRSMEFVPDGTTAGSVCKTCRP